MDVKNILDLMSTLTSTSHTGDAFFENNLRSVQDLDPSSGNFNVNPNQSIRSTYVTKTIELLLRLRDCLLKQSDDTCDAILSVTQCTTVSKCIDFAVSLGFIPCLIPSLWKSFENKQKSVIQFTENISLNMKYEELKFNVNSFLDLIKEPTLKSLIMVKHTNALLAGLSQLCLLPIAKPGTQLALENAINELRYEELMNEQKTFQAIFKKLVHIDRDPFVIRGIIFILGQKDCEKHLKHGLGELFNDLLIQPNGIQTILRVVNDLTAESSLHFNQHGLEQWSNVIHNIYLKSKPKYINHIVPQVWDLLQSDTMFHQLQFRSIAVFCIKLMHEENHNDFLNYYMNPIKLSLKKNKYQKDTFITTISKCIENVHTLFYVFKNEVWSLNPKLMTPFASIIYNLYTTTVRGVYYLKSKLEDLVFLILLHFSESKDHLKLIVFSHYHLVIEYGDNGDILRMNYRNREHQLNLEVEVELILDLMDKRNDLKLLKSMFLTLLDMFIDISSNEYSVMEKLFVVKAIDHLLKIDNLQKILSADPEMVFNLIASILESISNENTIDTQVLSVALMVLASFLENFDKSNTVHLDCFSSYLSKILETVEDEMIKNMALEVQQKIQQIQNSDSNSSKDAKRTIDDVLCDIRDPLLPCRSHALIELKKMIECGDKTVLAKKPAILVLIQENLKNADSYLYLSAIFTLSSLCRHYPDDILPILCEQFCVPKNYNDSPETRLKIGEVLMKTIRSLDEIIPVYKNRFLNTFISGIKDRDHLVRASSLSNLAEVCRLLRYSIGSVIFEILYYVNYILRYDKNPEPRRAAVLLLKMIITGADFQLFEILGEALRDIFKMLKPVYLNDTDEITKLHAGLAIDGLNEIVLDLLRKKEEMRILLH